MFEIRQKGIAWAVYDNNNICIADDFLTEQEAQQYAKEFAQDTEIYNMLQEKLYQLFAEATSTISEKKAKQFIREIIADL